MNINNINHFNKIVKNKYKKLTSCSVLLLSVLGLFAQTNTYLKFAASTGTPYSTGTGVSTYIYPVGLGLSSTSTASNFLPQSLRPYGISTNYFLPTGVSQSSVGVWNTSGGANYQAVVEDLYDNDYTTGALTRNSVDLSEVVIDLGQNVTFGNVQIAAITAANLNGASLQTSTDNINWTTVISTANALPLTSITTATNSSLTLVSFIPVTARYVRFVKVNGAVDLSEFRLLPTVSQSSGTVLGTPINLYDNAVGAAATTLGTLADEFVMQDLGCQRTFSHVRLSTAVAANLDGASFQVSNDGSSWTTVIITNQATGVLSAVISGSSIVYPITYTFASQTARYVRIRKAAAIVNVTEFQIGSDVAASSATSLALAGTRTTIDDASFTTGFTTTATAGITQWAMVNLGSPKTFSHIQLSTITATANLDGSSIQTSTDGVTWTTQLSGITGSSTTQLVTYFFPAAVTAQYVRVLKGSATSTLSISEFIVSPGVTVSSGAKPSVSNFGALYDNAIAAAVTTSSAANQFVMLDLGSNKTFSNVQIAAGTSVANLDGASLQVSTDAVNWTPLTITNAYTTNSGTTFTGSSIVYPITYTFTSQTARYIRVFRAATGVISLGEFRVGSGVFQSSASSLANNAVPNQFSDNSYSTGALTLVGVNQYAALNFGTPITFNSVELGPLSAITYLNGATLQTSNDGLTWTSISSMTDVISGTSSSTVINAVLNTKRTYSFASQTAQYLRLIKLDGTILGVSEFRVGSIITQSSGTSIGTTANFSDNSVAVAAVTAVGSNQWIMRDLGSVQSFNFVELATSGSTANLDGAVLQVSNDGTTWTPLTIKNNRTGVTGTTISGSSVSYPDIFSFSTTSARYVRVFRAASGTLALSEFQVSTAVFQSSGTTYATGTNLYDGILTTTAGLTATGTATAAAYIGLNFGTSKPIATVELSTTNAAQLNGATLEYSNDFLTWTPLVASISGMTANQSNVLTFSSVNARYLRVRSNSIAINLTEFKATQDSISTVKILNPAITSGVSAVLPIGFTFNFKGTNYSNFSVSSEGLLRLGTIVVTTEAVNNTVSIANNPSMYAFWDDKTTATAVNDGGVTKTIIGTAPNRKLVLEWKATDSTVSASMNLNYQIVLHETTNKIEYIYKNGKSNTTNATIGMAVGTVADITRKFYSVSPNAVVANTTYSNMKPNDSVRIWPGNGTIYTFTPTLLPTTAVIPTDFVSLDNAMGAVNWTGTPNAGGYSVTINGGFTERAPRAYATTPTGTTWVKTAGFLLTATGTAANPIEFKWSGSGAKPIFTNGQGLGNTDYIIGLAGSDYVTLDGLSLSDTTIHTSAFTAAQHTAANNLHAEMGIALFKEKYNTTTGNNGCNNVTIKNCAIDLSRWPNQVLNYSYYNGYGYYYGNSKTYWSRGIYATKYTPLAVGQTPTYYPMYGYNTNSGVKTQVDVHQNCTVTGNTINDCSFGIEWDDAWLKSGTNFYAGTNNKIGISGAGNTITNWGPQPAASNTVAYTYNPSTTYGQGSFIAGVCMSGQKDFTVEYNTITTAVDESGTTTTPATNVSYIQNFVGILIGRSGMNQDYPQHATGFFKKINNNTISDINVTTTTASNTKSAYGIVDMSVYSPNAPNTSATYASNGNVDMNNNTIFNIKSRSGNVRGISTRMPVYTTTGFYYNFGTVQYENDYFNTNGTVNIKNNTIQQLAQLGNNSYNTSSMGSMSAILYGSTAKNLYIENNTIGGAGNNGLVVGSTNNTTASTNVFINSHQIGLRGILVDRGTSYITPLLVSIKNNTLTNLDRVAGTIATYTNQRSAGASAICLYYGALTNNIDSNTITGMDIANGLYANDVNTGINVIYAFGRPKSGVSAMNVRNNSITAITRNQFGFLTSMGAGSGANASTTCIRADYASGNQNRTISGNIIDGITHTATYATTAAQQNTFYSKLTGIMTLGRDAVGDQTNIFGNVITNLTGANWNQGGTLSNTSEYYAYSVLGIFSRNGQFINIYNNRVCGLSTTLAGTTATDYTANVRGIAGILFGKAGTGAVATKTTLGESVYNNFVSELSAPAISEELAIEGIVYYGYGRFARIAHNTIALGDVAGGASGRLTTTGNTFGVNGLSINNVYFNTAAYPTIIRNNAISINATAKGSTGTAVYSGTSTGGYNTAWRTQQTTFKKKPLGIDNSTGGNVYFINDDVRNYIYGQGINTTGSRYYTSGLRNAYGYYKTAAPASYQNTTYNLVNDTISSGKYFNVTCGKYKSFWGSPERTSFIDLDGSNTMLALPFVNSGATCSDKLKISASANSYVVSAAKLLPSPLTITTDYFGTTRSATSATSGAHAAPAGATGGVSAVIDFDFTPICDGVCEGSKSLTVTITPPTGKSLPTSLSDPEIPRVYYRRIYNANAYTSVTALSPVTASAIVDNNWFYRDGLNNKNGPSGWRFAKASSVSGSDYSFNLADTIFSGSNPANQVVPTYSIEYFVMARTTDGTVVNWSSGDLSFSCPTSVIMNNATTGTTGIIGPFDDDATPSAYNITTPSASAVNHATGGVDGNSVADRFTVYRGADLTRTVTVGNTGVSYTVTSTTNPTTASVTVPMCSGEQFKLTARTFVTATGDMFNDGCISYKFQVANDAAFTSGLQTFVQSDSNFNYTMTAAGTKYCRFWLDCSGTNAVNTNSNIIAFTATDCPTNTTPDIPASTSCVGTPKSVTVTTSTPTVSKFFWVANPYGKLYTVPPTATTATSATISLSPSDTSESGTWNTYVTNATGNTVLDQVVKSATYYDASIPGYNLTGSDALVGKGTAFTTTKFIKLNALSLIGATGDGSASSGYKISLYSKSGKLIYSVTGASVADNSSTATTLTNWYIPPGDYVLALDEAVSGTSITGAFGSVSIDGPVNQPATSTPGIIIQGGVETINDFDNADVAVDNYFVDWDFTEYCTSPKDTFVFTVIPTSCCTVPTLPNMTITTDSLPNTCGITKYTIRFNNTTGAAISNITFTTDLDKGKYLIGDSVSSLTAFGANANVSPDVYDNEPNFSIDSMTLPIGVSSFTFQVDVRSKVDLPADTFTINNDCPTSKRTFVYPIPSCTACVGGTAILKNGNAWYNAGAAGRTTNLVSNVPLVGVPTSGAMKADITLTYASPTPSFEYYSNYYPRRYGTYAQITRYDNRNASAGLVTYKVNLKDASNNPVAGKPSFKLAGIAKISGQSDRIKIYGKCGSDTIKAKLSYANTRSTSYNTYTISGNELTASRYYYTSPYTYNSVNVNFDDPVTEVYVEWTVDRAPVRKTYRSLYIGDMTFACNNPLEPNEDEVYVETSFVEDSLLTCNEATIKLAFNNLNCDSKTINLSNTLPSGIEYIDTSYSGLDNETPTYGGQTFTLNNLDVPSGKSYVYVKVKPTNMATSATYNTYFNYTVVGGTNNPNPYRSDDNSGQSGFQDATVTYTATSPTPKPIVSLVATGCLDTLASGGSGSVITYTVTINNTTASPITNFSFENVLDSNQKLVANSLIVTGMSSGWVVNGYDTLNFMSIDSLTIPANTSATIVYKTNTQDIDTVFTNVVSVAIDPSSECVVANTINSNTELIKLCELDCVLVNPRVTYRLRKQ